MMKTDNLEVRGLAPSPLPFENGDFHTPPIRSSSQVLVYPEIVEIIKKDVPATLARMGRPRFVTRGAIELDMRERGIRMPGHDQYFSHIVNDAIVTSGYERWSNRGGNGGYKTYIRTEDCGRIGAEEARLLCREHVAGLTPASGLKEA